MSEINFASMEGQALSMWNRPGGKIKTAVLVLLFGIIAIKVLPIFIKALDNTAEFAWGLTYASFSIACAIVTIILLYTIFTSKKLKYALAGLWDIIMDNTIGNVVKWNPKVLAREQVAANFVEVKKLEKNVDEVAAKEEEVARQLQQNQAEIQKLQNSIESWMALDPETLENRGLTPTMVANKISVSENKKARMTDWTNRLTPVYNTIKTTRINLNELAGYAQTQAEIFRDNVEIKIQEYESMASANSAAQRFMNILQGKNDKSFMGERALMYMNEEIAKDSAELKQVLRRSKDFVQSINLQEAVYDKTAMEYLNNYKKKYQQQISGGAVTTTFIPQQVIDAKKSGYDNLI